MGSRLRSFINASCWLASLAYGSKMERQGHEYFTSAVGAVYVSSGDDSEVIYAGCMPSRVTQPVCR
jgi:hypothetical protein